MWCLICGLCPRPFFVQTHNMENKPLKCFNSVFFRKIKKLKTFIWNLGNIKKNHFNIIHLKILPFKKITKVEVSSYINNHYYIKQAWHQVVQPNYLTCHIITTAARFFYLCLKAKVKADIFEEVLFPNPTYIFYQYVEKVEELGKITAFFK